MSASTPEREHDLRTLHDWIEDAVKRGPVAVVCGKNGDMDTVGSAVALASIHPSMMACGQHVGRLAQGLLEQHRAPFRFITDASSFPSTLGGVVVVDAASEDQVGFELPNTPKCVLDHHATDGWTVGEGDVHIKWDVRSTTELVSVYLNHYHPSALTSPVCEFLLAGLITDTGRFKHANGHSFYVASMLIEAGELDYMSFIQRLQGVPMNASDRGAVLRGLQRAELTEAGDWSVMRTSAGTLEGHVAGLLNGLGADAVVVTRSRKGETRLTVRAPRHSVLEGLRLGDIMEALGQRYGGEGGGHDGAAGWTSSLDPIAAESAFINAVARISRGGKN